MTGHLFTQIPDPMVPPVDHADVGSGMNKRLGGDKDLRVGNIMGRESARNGGALGQSI
jgi:hypothetical protein